MTTASGEVIAAIHVDHSFEGILAPHRLITAPLKIAEFWGDAIELPTMSQANEYIQHLKGEAARSKTELDTTFSESPPSIRRRCRDTNWRVRGTKGERRSEF